MGTLQEIFDQLPVSMCACHATDSRTVLVEDALNQSRWLPLWDRDLPRVAIRNTFVNCVRMTIFQLILLNFALHRAIDVHITNDAKIGCIASSRTKIDMQYSNKAKPLKKEQ
jgi:hypothetical protein